MPFYANSRIINPGVSKIEISAEMSASVHK